MPQAINTCDIVRTHVLHSVVQNWRLDSMFPHSLCIKAHVPTYRIIHIVVFIGNSLDDIFMEDCHLMLESSSLMMDLFVVKGESTITLSCINLSVIHLMAKLTQ